MFASSDLYQIAPLEYQRQVVLPETSPQTYNHEAFKQAVFQRLFTITVPGRSKEAVQSFLGKLQTVLEGIQLQNAGGMFIECLVDNVNLVGQYQKDVAIAGARELYGDMVVTLASGPTETSVQALGAKIVTDLTKNYPGEEFQQSFTDYQLKISSPNAFVTIHITATPCYMSSPAPAESAAKYIPTEVLEDSYRLIDESAWFAANASTTSIKGLVRLLADLRERCPSMGILKDPALDLMAHYCITEAYEGAPLAIEVAFRRFLEFISMGVLLRDSYPAGDVLSGDVDPAAKIALTKQATELLCLVGQGDFSKVFPQ